MQAFSEWIIQEQVNDDQLLHLLTASIATIIRHTNCTVWEVIDRIEDHNDHIAKRRQSDNNTP